MVDEDKRILDDLERGGIDLRTPEGMAELKANSAFTTQTRKRCENGSKVGWTVVAVLVGGSIMGMGNQILTVMKAGIKAGGG